MKETQLAEFVGRFLAFALAFAAGYDEKERLPSVFLERTQVYLVRQPCVVGLSYVVSFAGKNGEAKGQKHRAMLTSTLLLLLHQ